MTKRFLPLVSLALLASASLVHAAVDTVMVLNDGLGNMVTIETTGGPPVITNAVTCTACSITATYTTLGGLVVGGDLGQFSIASTGKGGATVHLPTLENLNSINATSLGAGNLTVTFTDTGYSDFTSNFKLAISGVEDSQIDNSLVDYNAFVSGTNLVPAGDLIHSYLSQSGDSFAQNGIFANPDGASGSLTEETVAHFTDAGTIQANFTVSRITAPEPASVIFLGTMVLGLAGLVRKKHAKNA